MVCTVLTTSDSPIQIIACGPAKRYRRFYGHCEVCQRRTAQARRWDGMYYGYTEVCLPCGTEWQDGIALPKPSREMARRWWNEAEPAAQFDAWVREYQRSYFEDESHVHLSVTAGDIDPATEPPVRRSLSVNLDPEESA